MFIAARTLGPLENVNINIYEDLQAPYLLKVDNALKLLHNSCWFQNCKTVGCHWKEVHLIS